MKQIAEAVIDENGQIHLMEPLHVTGPHRALVTVLDEPPARWDETLMAAEKALADDWLRPEEDEAWAHLRSRRGRPDSVPVLGLVRYKEEASVSIGGCGARRLGLHADY
ncbi:hypothetical protein [Acidiferrobacter sp. SPIII_3]|uniref:hypothetical protein n=1 Tax=Acidiferrobacter sp. SPIII_3 TaxID=1281578 RepID=UPI001F0C05CC|nr:hypothetical protein [Acidiferrobacter sp. SPIII_3]